MQEKLENTFADRYERLKIVSWNRLSIKSEMQLSKKNISRSHLLQEFLKFFYRILIGRNGFSILSEFYKKSFPFAAFFWLVFKFLVIILSLEQIASEFFKNSNQNSTHESSQLRLTYL